MSKKDTFIEGFANNVAIFIRWIDKGIMQNLENNYPKEEKDYNISEYKKFKKNIIKKILQLVLDKKPDEIFNLKNENNTKNRICKHIKKWLIPLEWNKNSNLYILWKAPWKKTIEINEKFITENPIYFIKNNNSFWSIFSDTENIYSKIKSKDFDGMQTLQKTFCSNNNVILRDRVHIFFQLSAQDKERVPIVYSNLENIKWNDIKIILLWSKINFHDNLEMDGINLISKENKELIKKLNNWEIVKIKKNGKYITMMLCYDPSGSWLWNQPKKLLNEKLWWNRAKEFGLQIRDLEDLKQTSKKYIKNKKKRETKK